MKCPIADAAAPYGRCAGRRQAGASPMISEKIWLVSGAENPLALRWTMWTRADRRSACHRITSHGSTFTDLP